MRLINADALVEAVKDYPYGYRGMIVCDIAKQPTIDPVRHGKWIVDADPPILVIECSACGQKYFNHVGKTLANYCSTCGAKMDGKADK